jgi:ABC-type uncharacterized transport system substrate-binding protein
MDTKRNTSPEFLKEAELICRQKVEQLKPAVVITTDDNAQSRFAAAYANKKDAPQFVFCGVNSEPEAYGFPASNVTGVLERAFIGQSIDMLKKITPQIKSIGIISDASTTGSLVMGQIKSDNVKISHKILCKTFDEWKKGIKTLNEKTDAVAVLLYHTILENPEDKQSMEPSKIMEWTKNNTNLPTVGFWEFAIDDGALCAIAASGEDHGSQAGLMALQILNGKKASEIPVVTSKKGLIMLNLATAKEKGFTIPFQLIKIAVKIVK